MWPLLLNILIAFAIVKIIDDFIIQPFVFSNRIMAHPLEIFIIIMIGARISGVSGMILFLTTCFSLFFFLMIRRPPRSPLDPSSAASDVYKRQVHDVLPRVRAGSPDSAAISRFMRVTAVCKMKPTLLVVRPITSAISL